MLNRRREAGCCYEHTTNWLRCLVHVLSYRCTQYILLLLCNEMWNNFRWWFRLTVKRCIQSVRGRQMIELWLVQNLEIQVEACVEKCWKVLKRADILSFPCKYKFSLMNLGNVQTNSAVDCINTRYKHHLYRPAASLSRLQNWHHNCRQFTSTVNWQIWWMKRLNFKRH